MPFTADQINTFKKSLHGAGRILIVSHKNPDGDTLGSALGLYCLLRDIGKSADLFCISPVPGYLRFLPHSERFKNECIPEDYDLIIAVDIADHKVSGVADIYPQLWDGSLKHKIIDIDHHPFNSEFGFLNIINTNVASATVILFELLEECGYRVSSDMATCFLTGLYTDTGSFMHQNSTPDAMKIAGKLLRRGANMALITKHVFRTTHIKTLRLWGKVFSRTRVNQKGVALSALTEHDYAECGATREDIAGAVDYLKYIPGVKYASLLTEDQGKIKGSLRTIHDDVDVQEIAREFGGGGHVKAAGFTIPGKLQREEVWRVVE
jgi:phosphoesterase RecJ-like protein